MDKLGQFRDLKGFESICGFPNVAFCFELVGLESKNRTANVNMDFFELEKETPPWSNLLSSLIGYDE